MKKIETESYSELKITGALNAEIFKGMSIPDVTEFIKKDAEEKARKFVSQEWTEQVNVVSEYVVIDCRYNVQKTISARLVFAHSVGTAVVGDIVEVKR